jgi:hypothetical protein
MPMMIGGLAYFIGLSTSNLIFFIKRKLNIMKKASKKITSKKYLIFFYIALGCIVLLAGTVWLIIIAINFVSLNE